MGRGSARNGVCDDFGMGRMNDAGKDLIEWCEAKGTKGILKEEFGLIGQVV